MHTDTAADIKRKAGQRARKRTWEERQFANYGRKSWNVWVTPEERATLQAILDAYRQSQSKSAA